jgi:hypothetical protein
MTNIDRGRLGNKIPSTIFGAICTVWAPNGETTSPSAIESQNSTTSTKHHGMPANFFTAYTEDASILRMPSSTAMDSTLPAVQRVVSPIHDYHHNHSTPARNEQHTSPRHATASVVHWRMTPREPNPDSSTHIPAGQAIGHAVRPVFSIAKSI